MEKEFSDLGSRVDSQVSQPYDLQSEIFELTDMKEDLESSLVLNKSLLKQLISSQDIVAQKLGENEKLFQQLKNSQTERNNSQVKALLSEQIAEEAHRREFETVSEFEEKIHELKYFINRKELFTQELRKKLAAVEEEMEQEKVFRKSHVIAPSPQALQSHDQLLDTKTKIINLTKKIQQVTRHQEMIVEKSDFLQIENDKLKTLLQNPLHRNQYKNKQQIKKLVKPQLRLLDQSFDQFFKGNKSISESEGEQDSSLEEIQFPAKFQKNVSFNADKAKVPQLNLSNVKNDPKGQPMAPRIIFKQDQNQNKKQQRIVHQTPNEQRLEMLLERLKKRFTDYSQICTNQDFEIQNLQSQVKHYQKQNNQLAQALQNQNRKKGLHDNKEVLKKKTKAKLKRQNSNPLDYIDAWIQEQQTNYDSNQVPVFNLNNTRSARPFQHQGLKI